MPSIPSGTWPSTDANGIQLVDPVTITHQGTLVVFALQASTPVNFLYYNVLIPNTAQSATVGDWQGWNYLPMTEPSGADQPPLQVSADQQPMLRVAGIDLVTVSPAATILTPADAAFRVITDGQYISCFRVSTLATLYVDRFVLIQSTLPATDPESSPSGQSVWNLQRAWEVRYRRSQRRDIPDGTQDTLDSRNMVDQPFLEPTEEISGLPNVAAGQFAVALTPSLDNARRWNIFTVGSNLITATSYPSDLTGRILVGESIPFSITPLATMSDGSTQPMTCSLGASATTYEEQETATITGEEPLQVRRATRIMLAVPASNAGIGLSAAMLVYDFLVQTDGTLPAWPANIGCVPVDGSFNSSNQFTPTLGVPSYPVPDNAIRVIGKATAIGTLLGQQNAQASPTLFDSGDGLVHNYFAGANTSSPNLYVAQYTPLVTRAVANLPWQTAGTPKQQGNLSLVAQRSGTTFNGLTVTVGDCAGNSDLSNLSVNYGSAAGVPQETWLGLPRELRAITATLNGNASNDASSVAVQSGASPFYDYSGLLKQIRLPLGNSNPPVSFLTLVSHRPDILLTSANVAAPSGDQTTMTLTYTTSQGTVTQTWQNLPTNSTPLVPVLNGDAAASVYPYTPASGDTAIYGVATDGGTILLAAAQNTPVVTITISPASNFSTTECNVAIQAGGNPQITLSNVSRKQADFINALQANSGVTALFSYISADPVAGLVGNQAITASLDLRGGSTLFDVVPPAAASTLVQVSLTSTSLQGHTLNPPPGANEAVPNNLIALAAIPIDLPQFGQTAIVQDVSAKVSTQGQNGAWLVAHNPQALSLNGQSAVQVPLSTPAAPLLTPGRFWTLEAWCNPSIGAESRVLAYNNGNPAQLGGVVPSYFIGTIGQPALEYQTYTPTGPYQSSYVNVPADPQFDIASSKVSTFTWEALVNPQSPPCPSGSGVLGCVVEGQDTVYPDTALFQLGLDAQFHLVFGYRVNSGGLPVTQTFSSPKSLTAGTWTHVAVTGRNSSAGWTFQLYIDAQPAAQQTGIHIYQDIESPFVCIGASDIRSVSLFGNMAEVRCWQTARSQAEIKRTMNSTLTGFEPGLYGYWPLIEKPAQGAVFYNQAQATGAPLNGAMQIFNQPVTSSLDGAFVSILTGVGGAPAIQAHAFLRTNSWNHIAVVYEATGALSMNPGDLTTSRIDYGVCKNAAGLSFQQANSIEAWVQIAAPSTSAQTIFAQWGTTPANQAYQFGVSNLGQPSCSVAVNDPVTGIPFALTATGPTSVCDSKPHHLAATWSIATSTDANNNIWTTCTLTLYVDSVAQTPAQKKYQAPAVSVVSPTATPFTLGISALQTPKTGTVAIESQAPFIGVLTGLRFWSITLTAQQISQARTQNFEYDSTSGVTSAWWFDENSGIIAADTAGSNDITLSDTDMWAAFASIASTTVYADGVLAGLTSPITASGYLGAGQFTVGAYQNQGALSTTFNGQIAEVRIWKTARAQQQIQGGMYHPLSGNEYGLQAYWSFDATLKDQTGRGNDGSNIGSPQFTASAAPVANEGPAVRNIYNGPVTAYQEALMGTAAIAEYGDTGTNQDGTLYAVLYRRYAYTNPNLNLTENFSVGDLDLTYIGQAQTNPTLIGYIEGAPPVPSENLTRPLYSSYLGYNGYADCSTVALVQAETSSFTFSSQDYKTSFTMDIDFKAGVLASNKLAVGAVVWQSEAFVQKLKIGLHTKESLLMASQVDEKHVSAWTRTYTNQFGVRGYWEPQATNPDDYLNPVVGRRYQPLNIGYALVESMTADVYIMRMRSTGSMVGRVTVPNLDIPPDKNIILFQINPGYTKNGTLDGKVGFVNDPSYPTADTTRGSYFKPKEAYVLKAAAERLEQTLKTYFQQFDAEGRGKAGSPDLSDPTQHMFYDFKTETASKSIANTYVWSSNGGLYKSEEQFSAIFEKTFTGIYNMSWSLGPYVDTEFAVKIGVFGGLDLLFGGQIKVQVAKTETETRSFGLNVNVPGEPFIASYDPTTQTYSYAPTPGKVLSYRFMTFYLPPSTDNADTFLDRVIDQNWLHNSSDPDATVLRGAQIKGNALWRVLHRVTFVSRVPPPASGNPIQSVGRAQRLAIMLDNNQLLIDLVQQVLGNNHAPTGVEIGSALATILAPPDGSKPLLGTIVPWWTQFVASATGNNPPPAASALLTQILTDAFTYIQAGYSTGVLPLRETS